MMEVGTQVVDHTETDELFGGLLDGAVVIPAQGEDIDLEGATQVFEALVFAKILVEEAVAFRVGQDGGIAFRAQAEDVVFQFGRRAEERHLHQYVVIPEGKQGLAGGKKALEVVVEVIFCGGVELHGDLVFPQRGAHLFQLAQYDFPGIRVVFRIDMGRSDQPFKPQLPHLPDERQAVLQRLCAVVDAGQQVGVEIASQDGVRRVVGDFLENVQLSG